LETLNILLVEDSEADVKITLRAFKRANSSNNICAVTNGQDAVDFLHQAGLFKEGQKFRLPDLILMDINIPKLDGFQVLEHVKQDSVLKRIPVIVLTSSKTERDIIKSYEMGAASYIQKPLAFEDFMKIIDGFDLYWHTVNRLPTSGKDKENR